MDGRDPGPSHGGLKFRPPGLEVPVAASLMLPSVSPVRGAVQALVGFPRSQPASVLIWGPEGCWGPGAGPTSPVWGGIAPPPSAPTAQGSLPKSGLFSPWFFDQNQGEISPSGFPRAVPHRVRNGAVAASCTWVLVISFPCPPCFVKGIFFTHFLSLSHSFSGGIHHKFPHIEPSCWESCTSGTQSTSGLDLNL